MLYFRIESIEILFLHQLRLWVSVSMASGPNAIPGTRDGTISVEGDVAAITIPTPTMRFANKASELAKALKLCREKVDRILGNQRR